MSYNNKNKTTKNKINIYGGANIEQILSVIGYHLIDIAKRYNIESYDDIAFYFNSNNGKSIINLVDDNKQPTAFTYRTNKKQKTVCIDLKEVVQHVDKPIHEVNFTKVVENIAKMFERQEEINEARKQEKLKREQQLKEWEEQNRIKKALQKEREEKVLMQLRLESERQAQRYALIESVTEKHLSNYPKESKHKLRKWDLKTKEIAIEKYLGTEYDKKIELPLIIIKDGETTYVYNKKSELLKINKPL